MKVKVFVSTCVCVVSMLVCNALAFEPAVVPANPKIGEALQGFCEEGVQGHRRGLCSRGLRSN